MAHGFNDLDDVTEEARGELREWMRDYMHNNPSPRNAGSAERLAGMSINTEPLVIDSPLRSLYLSGAINEEQFHSEMSRRLNATTPAGQPLELIPEWRLPVLYAYGAITLQQFDAEMKRRLRAESQHRN